MKAGWEIKKVKDICEKASSNIAQNKIAEIDGDYPVYGASGFVQNVDFFHRDTPYIGIVKDGAGVGRINTYPAYSSLLGTLQYILPKDGYLLEYVAYALKSLDLSSFSSGATIPHIYFKDYGESTILVAPLPEQERIVSELDLISGVIDKKKQQLKELDSLAQSIFYEMFGNPVENEKGWDVNVVGKLADFYNGVAHENCVSENGDFDIVNSKFISTGGNVRKHSDSQFFPLFKNDIVMVMSDVPNGRALAKCYLIEANNKYTLNQRICAFRNYILEPVFLYYCLNRHPYYLNFDDGNAQTNLRKNDVLSCPIILPPLPLQQEFASKIEKIDKQKELIKQSLKDTETLFDSRMDFYFN